MEAQKNDERLTQLTKDDLKEVGINITVRWGGADYLIVRYRYISRHIVFFFSLGERCFANSNCRYATAIGRAKSDYPMPAASVGKCEYIQLYILGVILAHFCVIS